MSLSLKHFRSTAFRKLAPAQGLAPTESRVAGGPFAGMAYPRDPPYYPYLLGTYELELNGVWEELCRKRFESILDIGAAHGYYAIGLLRRMPECKAIAFEMDPELQHVVRDLANANGVAGRLELRGLCDAPALASGLEGAGPALVIMDVEGAEATLLDPFVAPGLRDATIVVEVHDFVYDGMGELIVKRFAATHTIAEIWSRDRAVEDFPLHLPPWKRVLLRRLLLYMMWERRGRKMRWLYLRPKNGG
jgi:hypothetical protein